jgi:hypothetical protein
MPWPTERYSRAGGRAPAACQYDFSILSVPESSPRETNVAFESADALKAPTTSFMPRTFAGSFAGRRR